MAFIVKEQDRLFVAPQLGHETSIKDGEKVTVHTGVKKADGRKIPEAVMGSFPEDDGTLPRTIFVSRKDILKYNMFNNKQWFSDNNINVDADSIKNWDKMFIKMFDEGADHLFAFVASKGASSSANGTIFFVKVDPSFIGMTEQDLADSLSYEVSQGYLTTEIANDIIAELRDLEKTMGKHVYAIWAARHDWYGKVKYPRYLMGTHIDSINHSGVSQKVAHNVLDAFNRLRIDFSNGFTVQNMPKSKIMTMSTDTEVWVDGENIGTIDDFDGWMMASGKILTVIGKLIGVKRLNMFKGVLRSRTQNGEDYIGTKSMTMRVFDGMEFRAPDGSLIARVSGKGRKAIFKDANGQEFDFALSTNESKLTEGKYSKLNTVHELEGDYLKINKTSDQSKKTAAFRGLS